MWVIFSIFALLASLTANASYDFPYSDPYYATLTAALVKADERDKNHKSEFLKFKPLPERSSVPLIGARNEVKVSFRQGSANAPLMVLVAGLGGSASSSTIAYLSHQFQLRGYHVLTLPSPFHWTFSLAASTSAYPGITKDDSKDLYLLLQQSLQLLRKRGIQYRSIGLAGISMGALEAAFLATLDKKEGRVGFSKTLLINPPVDMFYGIEQLDSLYYEKRNLEPEAKKALKQKSISFFASATTQDIKDPSFFKNLEQRFPTTLTERKFVIGQTMREFLYAVIFATQQIKDRKMLQNPISTTDPNPRLKECEDWSFQEYIEKLLVPEISERRGHALSQEEMVQDTFIKGIESELKNDPSIFLMHNADDFIVNSEHLSYLQNVFGMRMRLYPHGGHVGNLWWPENLEAILGTFQDL